MSGGTTHAEDRPATEATIGIDNDVSSIGGDGAPSEEGGEEVGFVLGHELP